MDEINKNDSHLRAKLFDLIEEQEKWQRMKDEAMGADTIDVLRGKIMSIKKTIAHHEDIIERCHRAGKMYLFPQKTEHSWYYNSPEYIPCDERDDWDKEYVIYGGDMYLPELMVSVKHSEKRVSIWQEEITKLEQRVIKFTIAQEQLTQVTQDIADINEQIKNATTSQRSEPLVEDSFDETVSKPVSNKDYLWVMYTSKATEEDKHTFENYLRQLCHSKKKSLTKDIKDYLKAKKNDGIIIRPVQINTEFELLKQFGYPFGEKAYYKY